MAASMETEFYVTSQTLVGQKAPDFTARAVHEGMPFDFTLSENGWEAGKYTVLFFYPKDFTFVCPTEIIAFSEAMGEFASRNCQVVGVSGDNEWCKFNWKQVPREEGGLGDIAYPLVADTTHNIMQDYGVENPNGVAYRGLFLIDRDGVIQHTVVNNLDLGRSVAETLRMLDALQYTEENGEVCPAGWTPGTATMKGNFEGSREYFQTVNA